MDVYLGFITPFGFPFTPMGWSTCQGQILQINQNTALFSLLGTYFGGNGTQTFGLPDLQGRSPMGAGTGQNPTLTPRSFAQKYGAETVTLSQNNLPPHAHTMTAGSTTYEGLTQTPAAGWTLGAASAVGAGRPPLVTPVQMFNAQTPATPVQSAPGSVVGSGAPAATLSPSLCLNFCIAVSGIYPSRT